MKATLLTGFLGSGKTTMLKAILRHNKEIVFGVIVNDLSELEVDGELIRMGNAVTEQAGTLISLNDGSISDRKLSEFKNALKQMQSRNIDHILIEASGSSHPDLIIDELLQLGQITLNAVIALVDAKTILYDYNGGELLLQKLAINKDKKLISTENLLESQLKSASVIALSKTDMISPQAVENIINRLSKINPSARFTTVTYGRIDPQFIFDAPAYQNEIKDKNGLSTEDFDIGSEVLNDPRPFHPKRLYDYYREQLGMGVFRSKGFIWLASRPSDVLLWNQAGGTIGIELLGTWKSAVLEDPKLLKEEREALRNKLLLAHPIFGDRKNEITVIGEKKDRQIFMEGLTGCLCTEEEIQQWLKAIPFEDPWPKKTKKME